MSGHSGRRGGGRGGRYRHQRDHAPAAETPVSFAADSPVLALFRAAAHQLNDRHDRHERLVKLSRDVTVESKRVIFLLHSAVIKEDAEKVVTEATERLDKLINVQIKAIAMELEHSPQYLHARAVSPGLQEFVEAKLLCEVIRHGTLQSQSGLQQQLRYTVTNDEEASSNDSREVEALLPPVDYMLGMADLTGELMRRVVNSVSSGQRNECQRCCQIVRDLYRGFLGVSGGGREMARKLSTTRTNVSKVEAAVYALQVRGDEAPATLLLSQPDHEPAAAHDDIDEGYY